MLMCSELLRISNQEAISEMSDLWLDVSPCLPGDWGEGVGGLGREEATPCFSCMGSPVKMICRSSQHNRCSRQKGLCRQRLPTCQEVPEEIQYEVTDKSLASGSQIPDSWHIFTELTPVVQKLDSATHRINLYPVDNAIEFPN